MNDDAGSPRPNGMGDRSTRHVSRRAVLRWSGTAGALAVGTTFLQACSAPTADPAADANGVILPPGFTSRIVAKAGSPVAGSGFYFRAFPDGGSTFVDDETPGGWYYVVNHEIPGAAGGVSAIRFAPDGTIVGAHSICADTSLNCAGGSTPWGTWLTCEEFDWGHVWECDPTGVLPPQMRPAMGAFAHEAAAVARDDRVYLTEDRPNGAFYRFTPTRAGDLSDGLLELATGPTQIGKITWVEVPVVDPQLLDTPCRRQVRGTIPFDGAEGIATKDDLVWFSTKGDDRIWQYSLTTEEMALRYQGDSIPLSGVDNLWIDDASGALFIAEDGGNMEVVMLRPDNTAEGIIRVPDQDASEITGPSFSPDGQRLYFNSQRGPVGPLGLPFGITYEISGPFDELLGRV